MPPEAAVATPGPPAPRAAPSLEPYRVLFPIGLAFALIGGGVWPLTGVGALGWAGSLHRAVMMEGFETAFVLGFLLTSMAAFTHGPKCRPAELALATGAMLGVLAGALAGRPAITESASLVALLGVGLAIASRLRHARVPPAEEYAFVIFGLSLGALGATLRLAAALGADWAVPPRFAERLTSLGMVLSLVLGLGGLLVPTFAQMPRPLEIRGIAGPHERGGRRVLLRVALALLALAFALDFAGRARAGAVLRAAVAALVVALLWKPWRRPGRRSTAAWMLVGAGWLIVAGLVGAALVPLHETAALHITFIGGFAALTLSVATRVVASHGRHGLGLEDAAVTPWVAAALGAALLTRIVAEFDPARASAWLAAAGVAWWIAWGAWAVRALPAVFHTKGVPT
ncbi:MAG TPA: NnrS family protein [Candidatus Saccharimonadaceae bacterium]|nr:NnrS family protein [Candidatus Saccharimonadaceae bacterium]